MRVSFVYYRFGDLPLHFLFNLSITWDKRSALVRGEQWAMITECVDLQTSIL